MRSSDCEGDDDDDVAVGVDAGDRLEWRRGVDDAGDADAPAADAALRVVECCCCC